MGAEVLRAGDVGDEAACSAEDAGQPLDPAAVRADDDLIEALSAGLVPPPSGPRDPSDVDGELVALLAGWVADIRPETLLHRPGDRPALTGLRNPPPGRPVSDSAAGSTSVSGIPVPRIPTTRLPTTKISNRRAPHIEPAEATTPESADTTSTTTRFPVVEVPPAPAPSAYTPDPVATARTELSSVRSLLEYDDPTQPIPIVGRRASRRPYLVRAAAAVMAGALVVSGVLMGSYDAHPGEPLWTVAQMVFPAKSRSVAAASAVSTALNTARVALERGRIGDAQAVFSSVQAQLAVVDDADGRSELDEQTEYLDTQLGAAAAEPPGVSPVSRASTRQQPPLATGQAGAVIPSNPTVTPGATQALATTTPAPPVLAAAQPAVSSPGRPPVDPGTSALAIAAPPAPSGPAASAPAASAPADSAPADSAPDAPSAATPPGPPTGPASPPPPVSNPTSSGSAATEQSASGGASPDPATSASKSPPADSPTTQQTAPESTTPDPIVDSVNTDDGVDGTGSSTQSQANTSGQGPADSTSSSGAGGSGGGSSTDDGVPAAADPSADVTVAGNAGSSLGHTTSAVSSTNGSS